MGIFVAAAFIVIAFISLVAVFVANSGDKQEQEPQQPAVATVASSGNSAWDNGEIAMCFDVAGINKNECTLDHVGPIEGYIEAEPDNAYDPNAIKVMHRDGAKLGYIKAVETDKVRQLFGGSLQYTWPVVGYVKHIIRPGSVWNDEKDENQQLQDNGYFVCRIYLDNQTPCDF